MYFQIRIIAKGVQQHADFRHQYSAEQLARLSSAQLTPPEQAARRAALQTGLAKWQGAFLPAPDGRRAVAWEAGSCRLTLVTTDQDTYQAFAEYFGGMANVEVVQSTVEQLASTADTMVSPANTQGNMDGGVDRAYADMFPWSYGEPYHARNPLQTAIHAQYANGRLPIGAAITVPVDPPAQRVCRLIAAPTMKYPSQVG